MRELFLCKSCGFESDVKLRVFRADRAPICKLCHGRVTKARTKEALKPNDTIRVPDSITEGKERSVIRIKLEDYLERKRIKEINREYGYEL